MFLSPLSWGPVGPSKSHWRSPQSVVVMWVYLCVVLSLTVLDVNVRDQESFKTFSRGPHSRSEDLHHSVSLLFYRSRLNYFVPSLD